MASVIAFAVSILSSLWTGFVLYKGWGWFVVPLGAPSVGMFHVMGLQLMLTVAMIWQRVASEDKDAKFDEHKHVTRCIAYSLTLCACLGVMAIYNAIGG